MGRDDDGDGEHGVGQAGAENGDDDDGEQQARQRQHDVHCAHDRDLDDAAEEPGDEPQQDARAERQRDHEATDQERQPGAVNEAREYIAADVVGAEDEPPGPALLPNRRHQKRVAILLVGIVRRHDIGEDREQRDDGDDHHAHDRALVLAEVDPELPQRMGRGGRGRGGHGFSGHGGCAG